MQNVVNWLNEAEIAPPEDLQIINRLLTNMVAFESKPGTYKNKLYFFYTETGNSSSDFDVYLRYKDLYEKEMYHLRYKDMYENRNASRP